MRQDEITEAVLSREEVARYLRGDGSESAHQAAQRVHGYLVRPAGANLAVRTGGEALDAAAEPPAARGIIVIRRNRYRSRQRCVLRYYTRSIRHLLHDRGGSALTH